MRVLVTGATGLIGSHTAAAVRAAGHDLRLFVRDPAKAKRVFAPRGTEIAEIVTGDVTDAAAVNRALEDCDAVIHTAAVVALESGRSGEVLATNPRGVENVVGGAAERGIERILYVSSAGALFTPGGPSIRADSPLGTARSAYARSKADAERSVRHLQEAGAPIRTIYPPAVIGPDDPGLSEGNHTIRTFLKDTMVMTSSGFQLVDVRDLAVLHVELLDADPGRYVAAGHLLTWPELADLIDGVTGTRVRRVPAPGPLLRALGRVGDVVKRVWPFDFPLTREAMEFATQWPGLEPSPRVQEMGVRFRPPSETLVATIAWLYRAGHLPARRVGRLAD